jgi:hypothetical protein
MRFALLSLSVLTAFAAAPASALTVYTGAGKVVTGPSVLPSVEPLSARASNITASDTQSVIAPALPSVDLGPSATGTQYLLAAQSALAANQTGRAQSALEHAETLLLTRPVPIGTTGDPDQSPEVRNISAALRSLAAGDTQKAMALVQQTVPMAQQDRAANQTEAEPMGWSPPG